jgi:hypothetical protein
LIAGGVFIDLVYFASLSGPRLWKKSVKGGGDSFSESPIGSNPVGFFFSESEVKIKRRPPVFDFYFEALAFSVTGP